eukprot:1154605-Pelagomonas_calceolata.AAC.4
MHMQCAILVQYAAILICCDTHFVCTGERHGGRRQPFPHEHCALRGPHILCRQWGRQQVRAVAAALQQQQY